MTRLDQLLELCERILNHPVVTNGLMIIASLIIGLLVIAPWLADIRP